MILLRDFEERERGRGKEEVLVKDFQKEERDIPENTGDDFLVG
jgi:hypothetical protein